MDLDTKKRQQVIYFIGTEIEDTCLRGERTLFIVGIRPVEEILKIAQQQNIKCLYFGTSQSFNPVTLEDYKSWEDMMQSLLEKDYWVSLDFGIEHIQTVINSSINNHSKFVPMISAKIPNYQTLNKNATLKIDDTTWGHSNSGVWSRNLKDLTQVMHYTDWSEYVGDTIIDIPK